ncbi:MAG: alpha/beta fold hydrolase [Pseudonocardiaceae bacterium]
MIIPGIGGSILESPEGDVLWKATLPAIGRLLRHPDRFARDEIASPVGLTKNWALLPGFTVLHGYQNLLEQTRKAVGVNTETDAGHPKNRNLDARVVAFPYDFRQSIVKSAEKLEKEIDERLTHLGWKNQPNRVIIIAHSMGGLIARYWVAQGHWGLCRAVLTLGTPHRGAPKALEYLVNGPPWWVPGRRELLRNLIRDWPSVYELVPRYRSVADIRSQNDSDTEILALYPKDLSLPGLQKGIADAFTVHQHIEDAWERNAVETDCIAYLGRGHGTLLQASWDGKRLISSKKRPIWLRKEMAPEERGDGTVPELSAIPIEQANRLRNDLDVTERHSRLVTAPECTKELARLLMGMRPPNRAARDHLPSMIGLDVEDSYLRGYPVDVQAWLTPRLDDPRLLLAFTLTCNGEDGMHLRNGRLGRGDGGVWSTTFTDLAAGIYELIVYAVPRNIFYLSNSECFFVLDERDLL